MPRKAHAQGGEGATRLNLLIEPQFGGDRGVVAGTRPMISSRLNSPVAVRREDLVEAAVAAELAGAHVDPGDTSVVDVHIRHDPLDAAAARRYEWLKRRLQAAHFHSIQRRGNCFLKR